MATWSYTAGREGDTKQMGKGSTGSELGLLDCLGPVLFVSLGRESEAPYGYDLGRSAFSLHEKRLQANGLEPWMVVIHSNRNWRESAAADVRAETSPPASGSP